MIPLPQTPESPNVRALARWDRVRLTGLTAAAVALPWAPLTGCELVYRNGVLLDPATYAIRGATLTLGAVPATSDVVIVVAHHL